MNDRSIVSLVNAATDQPVDAFLIDDVTDDFLLAADNSWVPILLQAAIDEKAQGIQHASHTHWRWGDKAGTNRGARRVIGIEHNGEPQALIALCLDRTCRIDVQIGQPLVYVDYIETAPWNLERYANPRRFRGCGPRLIRAALEISTSLGWKGRLGLHSVEEIETLQFYREVCKMTEMPPDPAYYNLRYFEMTEAQAVDFEKRGNKT